MTGLMLFALTLITGLTGVKWRDAPENVPDIALAGQASDASRLNNVARADAGVDSLQAAAIYRLSGEKSLRPERIGDEILGDDTLLVL